MWQRFSVKKKKSSLLSVFITRNWLAMRVNSTRFFILIISKVSTPLPNHQFTHGFCVHRKCPMFFALTGCTQEKDHFPWLSGATGSNSLQSSCEVTLHFLSFLSSASYCSSVTVALWLQQRADWVPAGVGHSCGPAKSRSGLLSVLGVYVGSGWQSVFCKMLWCKNSNM